MQEIVAKLTAKDDKYACAIADKITSKFLFIDEFIITQNRELVNLYPVNNRK